MPDPAATRRALIDRVLSGVEEWEARWGRVADTQLPEGLETLLDEYAVRMDASLPFYHPRYAGQMLKSPHPVAVAGYLAAMIVNPNNHALDASQATSPMEFEVVRMLAGMFGLPDRTIGHLTSSGTIANLEALWVARELRPDTTVVYSQEAHYTHQRMCQVLGVRSRAVPTNPDGRIDLDAAEAACRRGDVGTLVLTPGTTGLGAVDDIHEALALRERYGVRLHVDAAYGGFFTLLGGPAFEAIASCDSVVVDPHKHGLQPYGCGAVLFADPSVARLYRHDSPYTYFTSDEPHLGETSLECSRAGAAAAALWLTLRALPLRRDSGLGPILDACLRAARSFAARLDASETMTLHVEPALDIVTYFPTLTSMRAVDSASDALLHAGMEDEEDPVFLSSLRVGAEAFAALHPGIDRDAESARVLRSVLMKPEHEHSVAWLAERVETLAAGVTHRPGDPPGAAA
ncbi:aminotransferase class V-fold PLP-dependent enzyme [soil metagenome]